ncbi:MAG: tetratricopeptide repeat protein [Lachnospiraceae bacterium]|nr:tetratricopeptide repeat protein [Lachnospiraceae bacterium]
MWNKYKGEKEPIQNRNRYLRIVNQKIVCLFIVIGIAGTLTGCSLQKKSENVDAGMKAIESQDYNGALDSFEKALVNGEDQQLIYRGQGIAYMGLVQYEDAIDAFLKAIAYNKTGPDSVTYDMNYYLATAYYKTSQYKKAINVYSSIIALKPKEADAYYLRGSVELDDGSHDAAVADFEKAMDIAKTDYDMYIHIYQSFEKNNYAEEGKGYLKNVLDHDSATMSNYNKGRIHYYLQDYDNARNELEEARTEAAKDANVILMLGKTYEKLGDYNYAASVYTDYLKDDTTQVEVYNQLGLCKLQMMDYQAALDAFQAALQVENNSLTQTIKYNEIVAYEFLGEYKQATVNMEKYLKLYPDDTNAQREYEFLQTR